MTTDDSHLPEPHEDAEATGVEELIETPEVEESQPIQSVRPANRLQSTRNLWIVIGGLTFLLILSMLLSKRPERADASPGGADLTAMHAEVEALQSELNRQLAELNLPPLATQGEDAGEITQRIRKDTEALLSMMDQHRMAAAEKDRMLAEKNQAFIRSEQIRQSLTAELSRVQANSVGNAQSQQELTSALARANRLADELAIAREMITELSAPQDTGELESLRQRLEEATRARDFFEQRTLELEKALSTPDGPPLEEEE